MSHTGQLRASTHEVALYSNPQHKKGHGPTCEQLAARLRAGRLAWMLTSALHRPRQHRPGRQHLEATHAGHGMESKIVTLTKLSAGHMVYILCWWRIALPWRQRWSAAIQCWRFSGCSIKDQRMLKVLLMRGKLPLMASRQREEKSYLNRQTWTLFFFALQKEPCISNLEFLIFLCWCGAPVNSWWI